MPPRRVIGTNRPAVRLLCFGDERPGDHPDRPILPPVEPLAEVFGRMSPQRAPTSAAPAHRA
jgi:hypothetical protein